MISVVDNFTEEYMKILKAAWLLLFLMFTMDASAQRYALIVGVSDYPNLPESAQLIGPANDVDIVFDLLLQNQFNKQQIFRLSTRKGLELPTRVNILGRLEQFASEAKHGDFYYLHFSGHGSRQPALTINNDEADGLDELFLPTDVRGWNNETGVVENAILDDEIAHYVDAIRDRGAHVWLVFDSCHSGTMTRGAAISDSKLRQVSPLLLSIPDRSNVPGKMSVHKEKPDSTPMFGEWNKPGYHADTGLQKALYQTTNQDTPVERGELIAFSAAQSTQTTPEMRLPRGNESARTHGLFTYALVDVLTANAKLSYQQLAQKILARYETIPWRSSIPLFSATDLSRSVFGNQGGGATQFIARVHDDELIIQGGLLSRLTPNSTIEVFSDALSEKKHSLAKLKIRKATAATSYVDIRNIHRDSWPSVLYVRLIDSAVSDKMNIGILPSKTMTREDTKTLQSQLQKVVAREEQFEFTTIESASILVSQFDNKYWFLRADQSLPCNMQLLDEQERSFCISNRSPQRLLNIMVPRNERSGSLAIRNSLLKIANVERLIGSNTRLAGTQTDLNVEFKVKRNNKVQPLPVNLKPELQENDQILFTIENVSRKAQDINIFFIDSQYGVTQLYPEPGQPNRLQANESLSFDWYVNVSTVGVEHLLLFSQLASGVGTNFSYLEQAPLQVSTRGFRLGSPPDKGGVELFSWRVSD